MKEQGPQGGPTANREIADPPSPCGLWRASFGLRIERQKAKTRDGGPRGFAGRGGGEEGKLAETVEPEWCWKSRGPLFERNVP
jgi:hypothetical protein